MKEIFHVHTYRCKHGSDEKDEELIQCAISLGAEKIVFTDHVPFPENPFDNRMDMEELDEYLKTLFALKEKYQNQIKIKIGFEVEYLPKYFSFYESLRKNPKVDILILGQHFYQCGENDFSFEKDSDFRKTKEHIGCFSAMIEGVKSGLFDCVAHPDRCFKRCKEWTSEMENLSKELINAVLEKDIPLEINISSYTKPHKKIFWKEFWSLVENHNQISDKKIKTVIGVDSHSTEEMKDRVEVAKMQFCKKDKKMAEYYNMVLDETELKWFFDQIIEKPLEYESYMILLACRGKKLTDEEREFTKVGSRGEMMREELIHCRGGLKQEWNFDIYRQAFYRYNCDKRSLLTTAGVPYPEHAMTVYSVINPSNEIDCIEDTFEHYNSERKNLTSAILRGSKIGVEDHLVKMPKIFEHMKSCHAAHTSRRIWLDFDMDIKSEYRSVEVYEECYQILHKVGLQLFGKGNFAIIKTNGGYHTLVKKSCLKFNPQNFIDEVYNQAENPNFQKYFAEFMLNDSCHKTKTGNNVIKRSAMIPTPGCRQYDSFPVVMNKEDFE